MQPEHPNVQCCLVRAVYLSASAVGRAYKGAL